MFKRLRHSIDVRGWTPTRTQNRFGVYEDGEFKGIHYQYAEAPEFDIFYRVIPNEIRHHFCLSVMIINTEVPPHTDSGIKAALNLYIKPDNCITEFYEIKKNIDPAVHQIGNQTDGYMYQECDLDFVGCFVAKPADIWLLDVSKPHSVKPLAAFNKRVVATLATNQFTYQQVHTILKENGAF